MHSADALANAHFLDADAAAHEEAEAASVQQEVHILASLEHPFIVRYYDSFVESHKLFLVMEYAPNGTLATVLGAHQRTNKHVEEVATLRKWHSFVLLLLHAITVW